MADISDEYMQRMLALTRNYSVVILQDGPCRQISGKESVIWEHARRNFALREEGLLSIVCPVSGEGPVRGVGIFNAGTDRVREIMDEDPCVREGIFTYEIYPCRGFPGDHLP